MTSKHDASKEKIFWHEGNFGEWIAFMENYINLCVASKCSFMVYKVPIEKNLNQDIDLCIPNLRTRIMNLAINRYRNLYHVLRDYFNEKYDCKCNQDAAYNTFRDYQRLILNPDMQSPYPKVRIPRSELDYDHESDGFVKQIYDMSLIEIGDDNDHYPITAVKELIAYLMEKYGDDYLGLDPRKIEKNDPIDLIIEHCQLDLVS